MFSCEFYKFLRTAFLKNTPGVCFCKREHYSRKLSLFKFTKEILEGQLYFLQVWTCEHSRTWKCDLCGCKRFLPDRHVSFSNIICIIGNVTYSILYCNRYWKAVLHTPCQKRMRKEPEKCLFSLNTLNTLNSKLGFYTRKGW